MAFDSYDDDHPPPKASGVRRTRRAFLAPTDPEESRRLRVLTDEMGDYDRPATRADCSAVPRPCPFVSCRHNLYLDVSKDTGSILLNFPSAEPEEMPPE